jgi:predicted esterase
MMKWFALLFLGMVIFTGRSSAQAKPLSLYDSAHVYYEKRNFKKAFELYEAFYVRDKNSQSNYGTYYAAVSACHAGRPDRSEYYLQRSAAIGYDLSEYSMFANDPANSCLHGTKYWETFISNFKRKADSAQQVNARMMATLTDTTRRVNAPAWGNDDFWIRSATALSGKELLTKIRDFSNFPKTEGSGTWTLYNLPVNDTLKAPFLMYIPSGYDPSRKSPLYIYLHGAAGGPKNFGNPVYTASGHAELFEKAYQQNAFIIFPYAKKDFNWLSHQPAFEAILAELAFVKSRYNIDDNKVYLGGHSDGGRGAFWFATQNPSAFAALFGICYFPQVFTGNTPLRNLQNAFTFYGVSATEDQLFPAKMVAEVQQYAGSFGAKWINTTIQGNHGLPYRAPDSLDATFSTLIRKTRNITPNKIVWETDDVRNGRYLWISISGLDTLSAPAQWHQVLNPVVTTPAKKGKVNFNPHKSGAITASVKNNEFKIETSCVKAFSIYLSQGLVDPSKPVSVTVNGRKVFSGKVEVDNELILEEFLRTKDRTYLPFAKLDYRVD